MNRVTYQGLTFKPYITNDKIQARVADLAQEVARDYRGKNPLLICVLNGAFPFASDVFMNLGIDAEITFIRYKSYAGTASTGKIQEVYGLQEDIKGRSVIVIEDIVDTGRTIKHLVSDLEKRGPADIKVATLLFKPDVCQEGIRPDYVGFAIPQDFIIGYGLDIDEQARNLRDIWVKCDE